MLFYQHQTFVLVGITASHVLIKWMVHSIEWRNEAKCYPGLITEMPPFPPLKFGLQYFKMKENSGSSLITVWLNFLPFMLSLHGHL